MATKLEERRNFKRLKLQTPLRYQVRGTPEFNNSISEDISTGGISFTNQSFIPKSTLVMLEIGLMTRVLNPVGRVAWSQPLPHSDRYRVGVEFMELNRWERIFLNDYINMQFNNA